MGGSQTEERTSQLRGRHQGMSPTVHTGLGSGDFVKVEGVETALISMETGIEGETSDPSYYPDKQEEGGVACPHASTCQISGIISGADVFPERW